MKRLYAIFDRLAEEFGPLFVAVNDAVAVRSYKKMPEELNQDEYWLYYMGEYDVAHGIVKQDVAPKRIEVDYE